MLQRIRRAQQSFSPGRIIPRTSITKIFFLLAIGVCAVLATRAEATVVIPLGLDELIAEAELIVEVRVAKVTSRWSENRTTIYTYVTLDIIRVVHGEVRGHTLTLRFEGGEFEGNQITVDGMPSFERGEQDVLFIQGNDLAGSPVVGLFQGRFKVVNGEIYDDTGVPIVEIRGNCFVKVSTQPEQTEQTSPASIGDITSGTPDNRRHSYRPRGGDRPATPEPEALPPQGSKRSKESNTSHADRLELPPPPEEAREDLLPTQDQVCIALEPQQDTGRRLSVNEFIHIISDRLNRDRLNRKH